jgi:hypothetical protein
MRPDYRQRTIKKPATNQSRLHPVNLATGRWDADAPPPDWQRTRNRWEFFQGVRSWLLLAGFVVAAAAITR